MRFSVLIPAFKKEHFRDCLESVFSQYFEDYEVIVVNDASPEDLDSVVEDFKAYSQLRYYKNEKNFGAEYLVDNWNKCLSYAEGEYVICMGDDDMLMPCCLSEYDKLIRQVPGLAIYHGWTEIIDQHGNFINYQLPRPLIESAYSMLLRAWREGFQWIGDFCFHTQTLREMGGFYPLPMAWSSDRISAIRAASVSGVANTQIPVFKYRVHHNRLSASKNYQLMMDARIQITKWYDDFLSKPASNDVDEKMRRLIKGLHPSFQKSNNVENIKSDMLSNGYLSRLLYWWKRRQKYSLTKRDFIKATFLYLKDKY